MNRPLYELAPTYRALLDASDGELDDALVAIGDAIEAKAIAIAHVLAELKADSRAISEEAQRLSARRDAVDARHDRLVDYLRDNMERAGITRVQHPLFTLTLQQNPAKVEVTNESELPDQYLVEVNATRVDKRAILDDYRRTGEVPRGCEITRGVSLRIR